MYQVGQAQPQLELADPFAAAASVPARGATVAAKPGSPIPASKFEPLVDSTISGVKPVVGGNTSNIAVHPPVTVPPAVTPVNPQIDLEERGPAAAEYYPQRSLSEIDRTYAAMTPVIYQPPADRFANLPKTAQTLRDGGVLRVVMLGDSIVNDTSRSCWDLLLSRSDPNVSVVKFTSVRGSTGMWWYKEPGRVEEYVLDFHPDLVLIGGISHRNDTESIRDVIRQIRAASDADIMLMTGAFGTVDPLDESTWQRVANPDTSSYAFLLRELASDESTEYLDLQLAWGEYVRSSGQPVAAFRRDEIHANEAGEQILGRILYEYFAPRQSD